MKKLLIVCSLVIAVLAIAPALYAQEKPSTVPDYKSYLEVKGGVFYPQGDLSNLNLGFNGELAYGYRFLPNVAVEVSSGYFGTSNTYNQSVLGYPISLKETVYAIPLTAAIKGIVPINKQFELYGLAGGGPYFVNGKANLSFSSSGASVSDTTTVWGGFLGTGVTYNVTPQVFVGLEAKYLWTTSATLRGTVAGLPVNSDFRIEGLQGTANLGFWF